MPQLAMARSASTKDGGREFTSFSDFTRSGRSIQNSFLASKDVYSLLRILRYNHFITIAAFVYPLS